MFIGLPLPRFEKRNPGQGGPIAPPPLVAYVSGDSSGLILPGAPLTGSLTGVRGNMVVQHRWTANGAEITGEATETLVPLPGGNVPAAAVLRYAPLVDGVEILSREVQLAAEVAVDLSGDSAGFLLPGGTLTGSVVGGLPGQVVQHRWTANGAEITGETGPDLVAQPGVTVPAEAVLRYTPVIEGVSYQSREVQLVPVVMAAISGSTNGEILLEQTLTGTVSGGLPGQVIQHRWTADGQEVAGETAATLTPGAAGTLSAGAALRYAPLVDGVEVLSAAVTLVAAISVSVTGDVAGAVLPGGLLTGVVTGGLTGQVIQHGWSADGVPVAGETGPELVPMPGVNVPAAAVLRYTPTIDGVGYVSDAIALVPAAAAMITGATDGFVLPDQTLTGLVSGGLADPVVQHRWLADGAEIAGATEASLDLALFGGLIAGAKLRYAPLVNGAEVLSGEVELAAPVGLTLTGAVAGELLPGGSLTGGVTGGLPGQVVQWRWLADGAEIVGESASTLVALPGVNVPAEAELRYAPLVDGVEYLSDPVQLVAAVAVTVTGDSAGLILPGGTLTGAVSGGLSGQVVEPRWSADGTLIAGETGPQLIPVPGGNVAAEAVLRYTPLIDGVSYESAAIQLVPEIVALISGDDNGVIEPDQPLAGAVTGGLPGQAVEHRWTANGAVIAGETSEILVPVPGSNVPAEAELRYAPSVDGTDYLSDPVQLAAETQPPVASQSLPRLTGRQRVGEVITLDASMLTGVSARTYYLDGIEIQGQTGPSITAAFMGALTCEVVADEGTFTTPPLHILMDHANPSHNAGDDAIVALAPHGEASHIAVADGPWSDSNTWDIGAVPGDGAVVLIPSGRAVAYDVASSPRLDRLRIDGALTWALDRSTQMLVETIIVPPSGHMIIGDAVDNRLPAAFTAEIVISNRAYRLDPNTPTDLDLTNDPKLLSRGILVLGNWTAFGAHRKTHVRTAVGHLPMAGDNGIRLSEEPVGWQPGDTIIIGGTAVDLDANGVNLRYDEERTIDTITQDGGDWLVTWAAGQPLLHNHDLHNDTINTTADGGDSAEVAAAKVAVQAEIDALQLPIAVKERNIIIRSEPGAAVHQRGHAMIMHMMSRADLWDVAFLSMGRTDKSIPAGAIVNGEYQYIEAGTKNVLTAPLAADANLRSRYPIHLHFCGFNKPFTDLVRNCFVEDAKGWAMVHHGCRADWVGNVMYRVQGVGMVSETGDELGRWDDNLAVGLETVIGSYRYPKGQEEQEGKTGDFAKWGYGFFYRGRAMVVTRNIALGFTWGHVFYHRSTANGISDALNPKRANSDVSDLTLIKRSSSANAEGFGGFDSATEIARNDYPIIHFDKCESIGCVGGVAVVKNAAAQFHDLNIKISNFLGWGVWRGIILNYIGGYLVRDAVLLSSDFDGQVRQAQPVEHQGVGTGKTNQVAVDNVLTAGFFQGVTFSGNAVQGISNSQFSQDDPRFIYGDNISLDENAVGYEDAGTDPTATQSVTRFLTAPVDRYARPTITLDFILGDFDGSNTLTNLATGLKSDNVSSAGILPKPWDTAGLPYDNGQGIRIREVLETYGYWTYQGENIVIFPLYFSDRGNAVPIKQMHALRCTGDVATYTNNGEFTRSAAAPTCPDQTRNLTIGTPDSFDLLALASGEPGTTLSLDIPWFNSNATVPIPNPPHIKPNYLKFDIAAGGTITADAPLDYEGVDQALAFIYDGQGRFCTVIIDYEIVAG